MKKILYTAARKTFYIVDFQRKSAKRLSNSPLFCSLNEAIGFFLHSIELSEFHNNLFEIPYLSVSEY